MKELFQNGEMPPSPKQIKQVVKPVEVKVQPVNPAPAPEALKEEKVPEPTLAVILEPEMINVDVKSSSSHFSSSRNSETSEGTKKKELLKQKLAQLKVKLQKAKSIEEKTKLLEEQRDKDLEVQKKAEAKAKEKKKQFEKKTAIVHTQKKEPQKKEARPKTVNVPRAVSQNHQVKTSNVYFLG